MAGTITKLEVQKHDAERVNVFVDGEYAFAIDILSAAGLRRGQVLSDTEVEQLLANDERKRAYLSAVRLLGGRPRSRQEIELRLRRKEFTDEVIASAIERLQGEGLIDDAEFARYWSENRSTFRPRSARAVRYELRQKGVSNEDMEGALDAIDDDSAAWAAVQPKLPQWQRLPAEEHQQKLVAFLGRRGFSYQTARRIWNRLQDQSGDELDVLDDAPESF